MNLEGIINISGKSGLYKVISQGKNTIIVESIIDGKRLPLNSNSQANMLEEIGIYTHDDTKPLSEIFNEIALKENYKYAIDHKSTRNELLTYFRQILPDYDQDRVYISDIKKLIQWYNTMQKHGLIERPKEKGVKK